MRDQPRGAMIRAVACLVGGGLALSACGGSDAPPQSTPSETTAGSSGSSSSPTSSAPGPSESAALYTLSRPSSEVEGDAGSANAAVRTFAEAISSDDRETIDSMMQAPTPEDPSILDQATRALAGAEWDFADMRWTTSGVLGPCYLLQGEGKDGPVHLAGTTVWNGALHEWEFTTAGLPGSEDYPDLPAC